MCFTNHFDTKFPVSYNTSEPPTPQTTSKPVPRISEHARSLLGVCPVDTSEQKSVEASLLQGWSKNLRLFKTRLRFLGFLGLNVRTVARGTLDTEI